MAQCCGEDRATPFCPMCGAKIVEPHPLLGLLKHVSASRKVAEGSLETMMRNADHYEFSAKQQARMKQKIAKWSGWEIELGKLLSEATKPMETS